MQRRRSSGFSLAELLIAMFIVVVGLAGVTAALAYGVKNSTRGRDLAEATQVARTFFEAIQGNSLVDSVELDEEWPGPESGINDDREVRRLLNEAPFGSINFTPNQVTRFRRNISVERVAEPDDVVHRSKLARVTVRVTWQDSQGEHKSELIGVVRHARP